MIIHSKFKDYEVTIHKDLMFLNSICSIENTEYVIDENVYNIYKKYFKTIPENRLIVIEAIEENKVIETALRICEIMTDIPAKRNARLVSIGGGIIQDITGLVANLLYRGIAWTFIPTTLLASCDSCIGGKTSLNYKSYKNLLGTFYPPDRIEICPEFYKTLTEKDFQSGLGEVVKFNIMAGEDGLANIEKHISELLMRDNEILNVFTKNSLEFKKQFIEIDEFDKGERIKLNFAHTFGHAIESVTKYDIPHGTAVAIGMIMADYISVKRGLLDKNTAYRSEQVLLKVIDIKTDLQAFKLDSYISAIRKDKKQTNDNLTAVLMTNKAKDLKIIHDMSEEEFAAALNHFCDIYKEKK